MNTFEKNHPAVADMINRLHAPHVHPDAESQAMCVVRGHESCSVREEVAR